MSQQLQLFPQSPAPPDRRKELERAIRETRLAIDAALKLLSTRSGDQPDETLAAAVRLIDTHLDTLDTLAQLLSADNEELKMAAGKLRFQRDEAIKARSQVLAYLRQRKSKS
jgi:hypothetical protein